MKTILPYLDPLGQAVRDYLNTGISSDILVESDIAEVNVIASSYFFREGNNIPKLELKALELSKGKILDVGAGAGCHSLALQNKGAEVTALDYSELCCEVLSKRGIRNIIHSNFFAYSGATYDTLLFLMNGIGIAGTIDALPQFLRKARELLNPGGQIIFDSSDIDYMYYEEDGTKLINLNSRYYGELLYRMVYNTIEGEPFPWLYIDYQTLSKHIAKFGFEPKLIEKGENHDYLAQLRKTA
jgi:2-polyprenyl-3-methyl-5-hydroxy-6-metoxy-1,4-benzoquinol methylase